MTIECLFKPLETVLAADFKWPRSGLPSLSRSVGTLMQITFESETAPATSVVAVNLPSDTYYGISPEFRDRMNNHFGY